MRSKPTEGMAIEFKNFRGSNKDDHGPVMFVEKVTESADDGKAKRIDVMFLSKDWVPYKANVHADTVEKFTKKDF